MIKYLTELIPDTLALSLKQIGMPLVNWNEINQELPFIGIMEDSEFDWLDKELGNEISKVERRYVPPTYAEAFDWFKNKQIDITVGEPFTGIYKAWVSKNQGKEYEVPIQGNWWKAANLAIEYALKKFKS